MKSLAQTTRGEDPVDWRTFGSKDLKYKADFGVSILRIIGQASEQTKHPMKLEISKRCSPPGNRSNPIELNFNRNQANSIELTD